MVAVAHSAGQAGVVIDAEGDVWLTWSLERLGGTRLDDYRPACVGLEGDRTVLGGRLPGGAVTVEALTDSGNRVPCRVGNAAWAVVLDQPLTGPLPPTRPGSPSAA